MVSLPSATRAEHLTAAQLGSAKEPVIRSYLICVGDGKRSDRPIELLGVSGVACQQRRITRSRVSLGQNLSTEDRVLGKRATVQLGRIQGRLVVRQLPDQILVLTATGVAEKRVGQRLHHLLALGHPPAV